MYDMLIITPEKFSKIVNRLVLHKKRVGIKCRVKRPDEIYKEVSNGRDYQEKIKYFIKKQLDAHHIRYVLLFGGIKDIPSRYCHIPTNYTTKPAFDVTLTEKKFVSDLYYADIYDENKEFSSWDTNNNNIFAEWKGKEAEDKNLDLRPDVAIGRIPCTSIWEAKTVINKIIRYEFTWSFREKWFNKIVTVAGDTYPDNEYCDGEMDAKEVIKYMTGFEKENLWFSNERLTSTWGLEVLDTINKGCGFLVFFGHGNPPFWATSPYKKNKLISVITLLHIQLLSNTNRLPVCFAPGCKNSAFDLKFSNLISDPIGSFYKLDYFPKCWSWMWLRKTNGGSIATIGGTGMGYMRQDIEADGEGGWSYMGELFFKNYKKGITTIGDLWKKCIKDYLKKYEINWDTPSPVYGRKCPKPDVVHAKTVESFTLFGDPSLRIGGYEKTYF